MKNIAKYCDISQNIAKYRNTVIMTEQNQVSQLPVVDSMYEGLPPLVDDEGPNSSPRPEEDFQVWIRDENISDISFHQIVADGMSKFDAESIMNKINKKSTSDYLLRKLYGFSFMAPQKVKAYIRRKGENTFILYLGESDETKIKHFFGLVYSKQEADRLILFYQPFHNKYKTGMMIFYEERDDKDIRNERDRF